MGRELYGGRVIIVKLESSQVLRKICAQSNYIQTLSICNCKDKIFQLPHTCKLDVNKTYLELNGNIYGGSPRSLKLEIMDVSILRRG